MKLRNLLLALTVVISTFSTADLHAKNLPEGKYMLVGSLLSGVAAGKIIPVYMQFEVYGDQMRWTFISSFAGSTETCRDWEKCHRAVSSLTHVVKWDDAGKLTILDSQHSDEEGMAIDRPAVDQTQIYDPLERFLDGSSVTFDGIGLLFQRRTRRGVHRIRALPAPTNAALDAVAFALSFELALSSLDHCVVRQVFEISALSEKTQIDKEILQAARFQGKAMLQDDLVGFYWDADVPAEKAVEVELARQSATAARLASGFASQAMVLQVRPWLSQTRPLMTTN